VVDADAQMFDTRGVDNSNLVSPRKKFISTNYTLPPKKTRVNTGIPQSRSTRKQNGSVKKNGGYSGGAVAAGLVGGAALGAAGAYAYN
jgi:hypothetical protein